MQREIKFRGKRVDTGEWVYGYLVKDSIGTTYIITYFGCSITACSDCGIPAVDYCEVIPETVGQYTGLKDKNGKEIYEGDIVKFKHEKLVKKEHGELDLSFDFDTKKYTRNYAVEFTNTNTNYGLRFRNKNIWFMVHKMTVLVHDAVVIGNIFDNPELLQEVE